MQASRLTAGLVAALAGVAPALAAGRAERGRVVVADVAVSEESCAAHQAVFTVTLTRGGPQLPAHEVAVEYTTADGSALAGVDYAPASGLLTFTRPQQVLKVAVPITDALAPGPDKTFTLQLVKASGALIARPIGVATLHAPTIAKCASCALSCDDGDVCGHDSCDPFAGCRHVPLPACSEPGAEGVCAVPPQCSAADGDGDGLSDAWETQGGIDFDCDGTLLPAEEVLTNVDPLFPDGSQNPHPSADPGAGDVFVLYDWMELPDQLTAGQPTACTVDPLPPPNNIFYPFHSDDCGFDELCLGGFCRGHSDEPDPAALQAVVDAFAARGLRLHLLRGHALAHANVLTFGPPVPDCIADLLGQTFLGAHAADFYPLKTANMLASYNGQSFDEADLRPVFHYAIFGHRHTCDSPHDCAKPACRTFDGGLRPIVFNETGLAEIPGNDAILSLGGAYRDRNVAPTALAQGGTFMHELGHNLGLGHGAPLRVGGIPQDLGQVNLNYKPNRVSVMNYNHMTLGIGTAATVGGVVSATTRLDYASFCLPADPWCSAGSHTPNTLDETNGSEADGIGLGTPAVPDNDIGYTWCAGGQTPIPGTGPVDFNCDGSSTQTWCDTGCDITPALELTRDPLGGGIVGGDQLVPYEDWPNLIFAFHCESAYGDFTLRARGLWPSARGPLREQQAGIPVGPVR